MVSFDRVRKIALALPGVEEGASYGTPAFKVKGKLMARLREDRETLVVHAGFDERDELIRSAPEVFFFTDHYAKYEWVLVRLSTVGRKQLAALLTASWRQIAPKRLLAESPASAPSSSAGSKRRPRD